MIDFVAASRRYGDVIALDDVTLHIDPGETVAVMGPNGAGKSTLLRVASGLSRPTSGEVMVAGRPARQANRTGLGFLAHESYLYGALTARENLAFFGRLYGNALTDAGVDTALARVDMAWAADLPVEGFSRGMEQRVAIARVFLTDCRLVFLDEPFTGLDRDASAFLIDAIQGWKQESKTSLMVTHDATHAGRLADRVVVLKRGRLVADEPIAEAGRAGFSDRYRELVEGAA